MSDAPAELSREIEELLRRFGIVLRSVLSRFRLSGPDAEELIQEVRIRVWHVLADGHHGGIPAAYFKKLVLSAAIDLERRRRRVRTESFDDVRATEGESRAGDAEQRTFRSPDQQLEDEEMAGGIARAVDALAEPRDVVVRLYLAGYDRFAIAELLGWTEGKTRNLLYRGLDDLRELLAKQGIEPGRVA